MPAESLTSGVHRKLPITSIKLFIHVRLSYFYSSSSFLLFSFFSSFSYLANFSVLDVFNRKTDVMLVNVVYFKGSWATQFKIKDTKHRPFFIHGMSKDVPTMYQLGSYHYGELHDLNARFIKLPYEVCE